jgi:hypothetical protein
MNENIYVYQSKQKIKKIKKINKKARKQEKARENILNLFLSSI